MIILFITHTFFACFYYISSLYSFGGKPVFYNLILLIVIIGFFINAYLSIQTYDGFMGVLFYLLISFVVTILCIPKFYRMIKKHNEAKNFSEMIKLDKSLDLLSYLSLISFLIIPIISIILIFTN